MREQTGRPVQDRPERVIDMGRVHHVTAVVAACLTMVTCSAGCLGVTWVCIRVIQWVSDALRGLNDVLA